MTFRKVLGSVSVLAGMTSVLFAMNGVWDIVSGEGRYDLKEIVLWLGGSVLVLAVCLVLGLIDYALERARVSK